MFKFKAKFVTKIKTRIFKNRIKNIKKGYIICGIKNNKGPYRCNEDEVMNRD